MSTVTSTNVHLPWCPVHQDRPDFYYCSACAGLRRIKLFQRPIAAAWDQMLPAERDAWLKEFVRLAYNANVWAWLVATGWESDGSSCSLDDVMGVRIGRSGPDWNLLPASLHDVLYVVSRRLGGLPAPFRKVADELYRDQIIHVTGNHLIGWRRHVARLRAHARYVGLRLGGRRSFQP